MIRQDQPRARTHGMFPFSASLLLNKKNFMPVDSLCLCSGHANTRAIRRDGKRVGPRVIHSPLRVTLHKLVAYQQRRSDARVNRIACRERGRKWASHGFTAEGIFIVAREREREQRYCAACWRVTRSPPLGYCIIRRLSLATKYSFLFRAQIERLPIVNRTMMSSEERERERKLKHSHTSASKTEQRPFFLVLFFSLRSVLFLSLVHFVVVCY